MKVLFWNACLEEWTGLRREQMLQRDVRERLPQLWEPRYAARLRDLFENGAPAIFSSQLHPHFVPAPLRSGRLRVQHTTAVAVPADRGGFHALVTVQDVTPLTDAMTQLQKARDEARQRASTDGLTGVANRGHFLDIDGARDRHLQAPPPRPVAADARRRPLQGGQRHLRPRRGRCNAGDAGRGLPQGPARGRPARPAGRRRVRGAAARDPGRDRRPGGGAPARRRWRRAASTGRAGGCRSRSASASPASRPRATPSTSCWRARTRRSTRPSARAATASCCAEQPLVASLDLIARSLEQARAGVQSSAGSPPGAIFTRRGSKRASGSTRSRCAAMTSSMSL